jgi:signal transduction histidine kinase
MPDVSHAPALPTAYRPPEGVALAPAPTAGPLSPAADDAAALERYRACLAATPAILYELCLESGNLLWVSENVTMLGGGSTPASAIVGARERWLPYIHPDDQAGVETAMRSARDGGRYDVEFRLRHSSGQYRWFRSTGTVSGADDRAGPGRVRGVALMHEEQRRLTLRERTYQELMLGVSRAVGSDEVLVHVVEAARRLLDANRAKLYVADGRDGVLRNAAQSGAVAVPVLDVAFGDGESLIAQCYRTGAPALVDDYGQRETALAARVRANETGPVLAVPVHVGGTPAAVLLVTRERGDRPFTAADVEDATHLGAQASFALASARRDANAASDSAAKSSFLSVLGHELRTPLNTMEGFLELLALETPGPLTARQHDYVARVRRASAHVLRLAEDLFDLSRAELGQARVTLADFDAREPLAHAADLVRLRAERAGLALVVEPADDPVRVHGDADRVRQILVNLLVNAVKFTLSGVVHASVESDGERVRFHVRDTGEGIPRELQERIFEPFFQARTARRRADDAGAGAGLGLAVSRSLARAMGGELSVASDPGTGSTFTLTLPAHASGGDAGGAGEVNASAVRVV